MDLKTVLFTALLLHFLKYTVIAQGGYYNEVECKLLPTQNGISSQFRRKASEKGVRMVYLNLKIGNDSYYPLKFDLRRWVWAYNITEPMLSLPDDFDILSLGLLNYQVRSMDVHLEDQPSGCLATLNSTLVNIAVGRVLLENVTTESSADQLSREMEVVCRTAMERREDNSAYSFVFRCCNKTRRINQPNGPSEIQCDLPVHKIDLFNGLLIFVYLLMIYYLPAFPLVLPDCIFSLQYECDKEDRAEAELMDSERAESDTPLRNGYEQIAGARDGHAREEETGASQIPVDDSSPVTCSALLRAYIQKLPDLRLSFTIKLAVMLYCILPCVVYIKMGLWFALEKKYIHKNIFLAFFQQGVSPVDVSFSLGGFYVWSLPFVLFLRPKHFLFRHDTCTLCKHVTFFSTFLTTSLHTVDFPARKSPDSTGNEILCHLRKLHQLPAFVWSAFTQLHTRLLEKLLSFCTCSLSMVNHRESRLKRVLCVLYVLFSTLLAILVGLFGAICLNLLLLIYVVFLLIMLSPYVTVGLLFLDALKSRNCCTVNKNGGRLVMAIFVFMVLLYGVFHLLAILLNSTSFVLHMLGFIMIGLYLNVDIVSPYVAFFIVVTTNIYLCYANLQNKYREFKELLLKYRQKNLNHSNGDQDTIPTSLFWFVSDRVLPIATETGRAFCRMALITIFLYLFLSWVLFFMDTYSISTAMSAVSVFVSGVIPGLFFRGITKGKVFVGWEKIKMKREIEIAVEEFDRERNGANIASGGMGNLEMRCSGQV